MLEQEFCNEPVLPHKLCQHLNGFAPRIHQYGQKLIAELFIDGRHPKFIAAVVLLEAAEYPQNLDRAGEGYPEWCCVLHVHLDEVTEKILSTLVSLDCIITGYAKLCDVDVDVTGENGG